ncbi:QWRF motif-containing protein 2-like [Typha latifolia]|uniref:QWRF motif-containing protein 2-like n=1 Tax=Typha latifolia TaxID=4733 RepID=UPI003C2D6CA0
MVVAVPAAAATPTTSSARIPRNPSPSRRPGFTPSEKDRNATLVRRPKSKEISSRYLTTSSSSSKSNLSSVTSTSTTTTTTTSSSSSASSRRFASPLANHRPTTPSPLPQPKRSQSVDRTRPIATPRVTNNAAELSSAAKSLCKTTRSLSVSFQGESFFYQTNKAKPTSPSSTRKSTPERRKSNASAENARPLEHRHCWPSAKNRELNPLTKSLDCSLEKKEPIMAAVRLLRKSMMDDEGARRASFDGADFLVSDTDSASSGSNSGSLEPGIPPRVRATTKGIGVPMRFFQETTSRLRRFPEPGTPLSSLGSRAVASPKTVPAKKSLLNGMLSSSFTASSPLHGPIRSSSPSRPVPTPSARRMASPSRSRNGMVVNSFSGEQQFKGSSVLSSIVDTRRKKNGDNRIEEAHQLRLLHNRQLQWCCVNARSNAAFLAQSLDAEKYLYNAWLTNSEMRDSVMYKRLELQFLLQNTKLMSILKGQMAYLEEWAVVDREHLSSLAGTIEALKASTLRLPVTDGAKVDIQEAKNAVGSAVDVMQTIGSSIYSLLPKVGETSLLVSELAKVAELERSLMEQSRELLSTFAAMHVKHCSLQGQIVQLTHRQSLAQP